MCCFEYFLFVYTGDIGKKVEVQVNKKWMPGSVVKVNSKDGKWLIKFDNNKRDRNDKW